MAISKQVLDGLDARESALAYARAVWQQAEVLQDKYEAFDDRAALTAARD